MATGRWVVLTTPPARSAVTKYALYFAKGPTENAALVGRFPKPPREIVGDAFVPHVCEDAVPVAVAADQMFVVVDSLSKVPLGARPAALDEERAPNIAISK